MHDAVTHWAAGLTLALSGHTHVETYAVLTRLPGDVRVAPAGAVRLMAERFAQPLVLRALTMRALPRLLAEHGIAGGAVYDALVALAAFEHGVELATRDARARATYDAVGATVVVVA